MSVWFDTKEKLPPEKQRVLIYNGADIHIAHIVFGISKETRQKMKNGEIDDPVHTGWDVANGYFQVKRSDSYREEDEVYNNKVPYCWKDEYSGATWFGQYVSYWAELPELPKED